MKHSLCRNSEKEREGGRERARERKRERAAGRENVSKRAWEKKRESARESESERQKAREKEEDSKNRRESERERKRERERERETRTLGGRAAGLPGVSTSGGGGASASLCVSRIREKERERERERERGTLGGRSASLSSGGGASARALHPARHPALQPVRFKHSGMLDGARGGRSALDAARPRPPPLRGAPRQTQISLVVYENRSLAGALLESISVRVAQDC